MQLVLLCGGKGTRMREETEYRPKPLVLIGGKPILWYIMKMYSYYGVNDFILCTGYKGDMIKQYFMDMYWRNNDFTLHMGEKNLIEYETKEKENWNITIVDTGQETLTAGRLKYIKKYIKEENFLMTYGDGLSNVNINKVIEHHMSKGKCVTITGVHPMSPFGLIEIENGIAKSFKEKPRLNDVINGGFMVMNKNVFNYIPEEDCMFEDTPLKTIAKDNELAVYEHNDFWKAVDTFKDVEEVNRMYDSGITPWIVWKDNSKRS